LQQHEKAADMVGVEVGEKDCVEKVVAQAAGFVAAVNRLAAINENRSLAEPIKEGGVVAIRAWPAVARPKTFEVKSFHRFRFR
jgi:hypothetical protein